MHLCHMGVMLEFWSPVLGHEDQVHLLHTLIEGFPKETGSGPHHTAHISLSLTHEPRFIGNYHHPKISLSWSVGMCHDPSMTTPHRPPPLEEGGLLPWCQCHLRFEVYIKPYGNVFPSLSVASSGSRFISKPKGHDSTSSTLGNMYLDSIR
jgi:hypothetical protein